MSGPCLGLRNGSGRTALYRFGSPDPRGHPRYPEIRASNDRSRLKGGHIGESPCLSKEKLAGRVRQSGKRPQKAGKQSWAAAPIYDPAPPGPVT